MAKSGVPLERLAVRTLFWMSLGLAVLFGTELMADLSRTHVAWRDLAMSPRSGSALASTVSRAFNNLCAMVLTFIALAVPITANMYTPKLIDIFIRDKVNIAAMVFFAGMGAHAVFGQAMMYDQWSPLTIHTTLWLSGVVGFAVLVPYYFYVLSFLNPVTIIRRVSDVIVRDFDLIAAGARPLPEARARLDEEILNLGNVILRAVDRTDRDVSLDAIHGLQNTVNRRDAHAIYDVFSQYTFLAKELLAPAPETALGIARHFKYYADFARWQGMPFIYELAAFDLVGIVEAAYDAKAGTRDGILAVLLEFESDKASVRLTKAQVLLASYFAMNGMEAERGAVVGAIARSTAEHIEQARRAMLATEDPVFWEVTDRQKNLDHVDAARRPAVQRVLAEAAARKAGGGGAI